MTPSLRYLLASSLLLISSSGCSSLGLSLWPAQFPLLPQAKEFAQRSPLPSGLPHELGKRVLPDYYIEPGDRILIEPFSLDSEFRVIGDQEVQVDGSIDLGEFGRLRVAGMTVEAIEAAIENQIVQAGGERESINVQLVETNASIAYVLGEVGSPGAYALDGNETVLDAILLAGGLTSRASPCDILLARPTDPCDCRVVLPVCYRQITQLGDVTTNYQLQPGDRVVVGARTFCEEIAFWRQSRPCERCAQSRCLECNPNQVNYKNRFFQWASPFALPSEIDEVGGEEATSEPPFFDESPSPDVDADIYLPPGDDLTDLRETTRLEAGGSRRWPVFSAPSVQISGH